MRAVLFGICVFAAGTVPARAVDLEPCTGAGEKRLECVERNTIKINATLERAVADLRAEIKSLKDQNAALVGKAELAERLAKVDRSFARVRLKGHGVKECIMTAPPHGVALAECSSGQGGSVDWTLERYGE